MQQQGVVAGLKQNELILSVIIEQAVLAGLGMEPLHLGGEPAA